MIKELDVGKEKLREDPRMPFKFWPQIGKTKEMVGKTVTQSHLPTTYEAGAGEQYVYLSQWEVPDSE